MDSHNSVPLNFSLEPVGERMSRMLLYFQPDMFWATVDEKHLEREILCLVRRGPDKRLCAKARTIAKRFSPQRIAGILGRLVQDALGNGSRS